MPDFKSSERAETKLLQSRKLDEKSFNLCYCPNMAVLTQKR